MARLASAQLPLFLSLYGACHGHTDSDFDFEIRTHSYVGTDYSNLRVPSRVRSSRARIPTARMLYNSTFPNHNK